MPTYDYICQACERPFDVQATMAEYAEGLKPPCPHCGARKAIRTFTRVGVIGGRQRRAVPGSCSPEAGPGCCPS